MKKTKVWFLFVLSLVILLAGGASSLRPIARETLSPYQKAVVVIRRHVFSRVATAFSRLDLAGRNAELLREVERLRLSDAEVERLAAENCRLRTLLSLPARPGYTAVAAPVLSRGDTSGWWHTLTLGKGANQGLALGDPVVSAAGLLGRITAVSANTADVLLISDSNFRASCEIETGQPEIGIVRGILSGGGHHNGTIELLYTADPLRLRFLRRDFEPPPRARVVTSGLGGGFPRGLVVGHLLESTLASDGLHRTASIVPAVDLADITDVLVLTAWKVDP